MSEYEGYSAIAGVYDRLNADIDYKKWADFFEGHFDRYLEKRPEIILDLACGTGTMTRELARRGYDMIGVDGSEDMLSEAYIKGDDEGVSGILYLCQDMRSFELYGTVGATVCCLDSINYLLTESDIEKTFSLVHNYSDPHGLFMFDVNSPYKFLNIYGDNAYILEGENETDGSAIFCGWQNHYDKETGICDFYLSLFEQISDEERYARSDEHQRERCYTLDILKALLEKTGFEFLGAWSDFDLSEITETTERYYIVARAKK
ncbi:MAG: class I SAM-dependent methyltransferase [Ruminococcaceae bacterium]|nr:class I SAM-dependent methyltransferase [Oscillospiraceae bacterium]